MESSDSIRLDKSGGRRSNGLPGLPPAGRPRLRNDTQPQRPQGCQEGLPDRELRLSRAGLHEPDRFELLGACVILIVGARRFVGVLLSSAAWCFLLTPCT